jgi:hypothetical protein
MLKTIVFLASLAALTSAATAGTIDIRQDNGGKLIDFLMRMEDYRDSGRQVRFLGECNSACTLFLALPNKCVGPDASFGFHAASSKYPHVARKGTELLMDHYPQWVRDYITMLGGLGPNWIVMPASWAQRYIPAC